MSSNGHLNVPSESVAIKKPLAKLLLNLSHKRRTFRFSCERWTSIYRIERLLLWTLNTLKWWLISVQTLNSCKPTKKDIKKSSKLRKSQLYHQDRWILIDSAIAAYVLSFLHKSCPLLLLKRTNSREVHTETREPVLMAPLAAINKAPRTTVLNFCKQRIDAFWAGALKKGW